MKISMWMILEKLEQYQPSHAIQSGEMCISGVRFASECDVLPRQDAYIHVYRETQPDGACLVHLRNTGDEITVCSSDPDRLMNELLDIFDFYNTWESSLWEAASRESIQEIVDIGTSAVGNPIMITDMDGNVLAMSSAFVHEDLSIYWSEARDKQLVPSALTDAPFRTLSGEPGTWTDTPAIYVMPGGGRAILSYLKVGGERTAGLGVWGQHRSIVASDVWLTQMMCDALRTVLNVQEPSLSLRSGTAFLTELLDGALADEEMMRALAAQYKGPWRLIRIHNPLRSDEINQHNLLLRFLAAKQPNISLIYQDAIVVLVSQNDTQALLDAVFDPRQRLFSQIGISLPFDDLRKVRILYEQTCFIAQQAGNEPGYYHGEDHAFAQILSLLRKDEHIRALLHPALTELRRHDAAKHSDLYETLYQYLLHEHSIQLGAKAMHVHKNTFTYRMERARALTDLKIDDPNTRLYLLFSFLIGKQNEP